MSRRAIVRGIKREAAKLAVRPTIIEALENPKLLGALPEFRDLRSWKGWLVVLKCFYGLELDAADREWLQAHTGRNYFDPAGYWTLVVSVGRQAGKSTIVAAIADYESIFAAPDLGGDWVIAVAQDFRGAVRGLFSKIAAPFGTVAAFKGLVAKPTADTLVLTTGVSIGAYPCRPAAIRGPSSRMTLLDEAAWLRSSEGVSQDVEMLRAIEPGLAMGGPLIEGRRRPGRLVLLSSPAGESGMFYDLFSRHWARDDSPVLVVQSSAMEMNGLLPPDYMERMREDDPEGYAAEALGQFRGGQSALLDPVAVRASVQKARTDFPYREGVAYVLHIDASSGRNDHYTAAVGHRDRDEIVVDAVRRWKAGPGFSTKRNAEEVAALARDYRIDAITGDAYAIGPIVDQFAELGIGFDQPRRPGKPGTDPRDWSAVNTSELMLDMVNPMHSGLVRLPDNPDLVAELISLERRRSTVVGVHDRVVCPPARHKDLATAVAGVVWRLRALPARRRMLQGYEYGGPSKFGPAPRSAPAGRGVVVREEPEILREVRRVPWMGGVEVEFRSTDGGETWYLDHLVAGTTEEIQRGYYSCPNYPLKCRAQQHLEGSDCPFGRPVGWTPEELAREAVHPESRPDMTLTAPGGPAAPPGARTTSWTGRR